MSVIVLILYLAFLGVSYWATTRIITQAGFSPAWILVPLTSLVLTIVVFIMLYVDLRSLAYALPFGVGGTTFLSGLSSVGIVWGIDVLSVIANWVLFLLFAFSRWPTTRVADGARRSPSPPPPGGAPQYGRNAPGPPRPPSGSAPSTTTSVLGGSPLSAGDVAVERAREGPSTTVAPATDARSIRIKHCVWCGESLPGSRALFHECGSKDRPATNCASCGASLPSEGAACLACTPDQ